MRRTATDTTIRLRVTMSPACRIYHLLDAAKEHSIGTFDLKRRAVCALLDTSHPLRWGCKGWGTRSWYRLKESRFPAGMTTRRARATTTAGSFDSFGFAQDDMFGVGVEESGSWSVEYPPLRGAAKEGAPGPRGSHMAIAFLMPEPHRWDHGCVRWTRGTYCVDMRLVVRQGLGFSRIVARQLAVSQEPPILND